MGNVVNHTCFECKRYFRNAHDLCSLAEMELVDSDSPSCDQFEFDHSMLEDENEYCPSATNGDYSPSNPWDAPGMSIKDFI